MKTNIFNHLTVLFFILFQVQFSYAQEKESIKLDINKDYYTLSDYVESKDITYFLVASYDENEKGTFDKVSVSAFCYPGKKDSNSFNIKDSKASFKAILNVVNVKRNEDYTRKLKKTGENITFESYTLKTKFSNIKTDVEDYYCDGIGELQVSLGLISEVVIHKGYMINAFLGKQILTFYKGDWAAKNTKGFKNAKAEKYLNTFGEMDFLYYERVSKDKQINQILVNVKKNEKGKYAVRVNFNVWESRRKKKQGKMLGAYTMDYEVESMELSDDSDNPIVYLHCKKPEMELEKAVDLEFKGFYWPIWEALHKNRKWALMPNSGILFNTGRTDFSISQVDKHDRLKYKR